MAEMRRTTDMLLPLLVGMVIGFLASFASFAGRLSTIETKQLADETSITALQQTASTNAKTLNSIARKLGIDP